MPSTHYELVVVGAGSGNMLLAPELAHWKTAIVESSRFGGTCLNRGCIPSKMLVHAADVAREVQGAARLGLRASFEGADWPAIRERVFTRRIDPLHQRAVDYRRRAGVDVYLGEARFVGEKALAVGDERLTAERVVLAVGSRPYVPEIPGLAGAGYLTSDDVMRIERLPASMIVLGGGYVAAEMSHVFGALGTEVTIVERAAQLLTRHDADVRERFTEISAARFDLRLGRQAVAVERDGDRVRVELAPTAAGSGAVATGAVATGAVATGAVATGAVATGAVATEFVEAEALLVATGRVPNSDRLDAAAGGLDTDEHGHIVADAFFRTSVEGVWALGDVANHTQLKHLANAEARVVRHNLLHPEDLHELPFRAVPAAVFAEPQVASVGASEEQLRAAGRELLVARRPYSETAYGWALEDTTGFAKVIVDPQTRLLLGAHVIGPQASTLLQPLVQAMFLGNTVDEVAHQVLYIHPALTELVEQVLLEL